MLCLLDIKTNVIIMYLIKYLKDALYTTRNVQIYSRIQASPPYPAGVCIIVVCLETPHSSLLLPFSPLAR